MSTVAAEARPRPGRPSTGARERILEAGLEVLKADAYAGLTVAKVAALAGENKALIAYHFGSKQGLVAAAGRTLGEEITEAVTESVGEASTIEGIVRGALDGIWGLMDRDVRVARVYFDLSAVSVVEDEVRDVMNAERSGWREVLLEMLGRAEPGLSKRTADGLAVLISAGISGLALERVESGETPALRRACEMFVRSTVAAASG
ncbi:MAG: TetR/AcrR family transcriptional regulator [Solirubrobacterales bacterium]